MNAQRFIIISMAAALLASILFLLFFVLRLAFFFDTIHAFLVINMLALGSVAAVGLCCWRSLSITRLEWFMFAALLASTLMADYTGRQPVHIIIDIARPLLFLAVIITFRSIADVGAISTSPTLHWLLLACIWATIAGVIICTLVDSFIESIYHAYSTIDSILGLGWLMAMGGSTAPLLFLIILVASGKRAVYMAAGLVMLTAYRKELPKFASVVIIIAVASLFSIESAKQYAHISQIQPEQKSEVQSELNSDIQVESKSKIVWYYTSGRLGEIHDATNAVPTYWHYIQGMGPGFTYFTRTFKKNGEFHRNLHFTPLSLIIEYGLIFSALLAIYIARMLPAAWRTLNDKTNPIGMSYAMYFFASLPFALTEYSIFAYANFAIACGLIAAFDKKHAS